MLTLIEELYPYTREYPTFVFSNATTFSCTWRSDGRDLEPLHLTIQWSEFCEQVPQLCEDQYVPQIGYLTLIIEKLRRKRWKVVATKLFTLEEYFVTLQCGPLRFIDLNDAANQLSQLIIDATHTRIDAEFALITEAASRTIEFIPATGDPDDCTNVFSGVRRPDFECIGLACVRTPSVFLVGESNSLNFDYVPEFRVRAYYSYKDTYRIPVGSPPYSMACALPPFVIENYVTNEAREIPSQDIINPPVSGAFMDYTFTYLSTTPDELFSLGQRTKGGDTQGELRCWDRTLDDADAFDTNPVTGESWAIHYTGTTVVESGIGHTITFNVNPYAATNPVSGPKRARAMLCGVRSYVTSGWNWQGNTNIPYSSRGIVQRTNQQISVEVQDTRTGQIVSAYTFNPCVGSTSNTVVQPVNPEHTCVYTLGVYITLIINPFQRKINVEFTDIEGNTTSYSKTVKPGLRLTLEVGRFTMNGPDVAPIITTVALNAINEVLETTISGIYDATITSLFPALGAVIAQVSDVTGSVEIISKVCN